MKKQFICLITMMLSIMQFVHAQSEIVTGTVYDENGGPLLGASVMEKGTKNGTQTDFDGNFTLNVAGSTSVLVVTYVGYVPSEVTVGSQKEIKVTLQPDVTQLDDVVLIGYQAVKRSDVTGAVSSISSEAIEGVPVVSVSALLATQATGLQVSTLSGAAGARGGLVIRGNTSIGGDIDANTAFSNPLYVVDGVQTSLEDLAGYNVSNVDFLASLSPNDIESIDILKDASAAAIYGSRGANGVIIIKTKGGKALDKPEFTFSSSLGVMVQPELTGMYAGAAERNAKWNMLNTWWAPYERQGSQTPMVLSDSLNPAFNNNVDYQGLFYKTGISQQYNLSVRGGSDETNYRISLGYSKNDGVIQNTGFDRYTLNTNINSKVGSKFRNDLRINLTFTDNKTGQGNPGGYSYNLNSALPVNPANMNSSLFYISPARIDGLKGELEEKLNTDRAIATTFTNFATLDLFGGLALNSQLTYSYSSNKKNFYEPSITRSAGNGYASYSLYNRNNLSSDLYLNYFKNFGDDHEVTAVLGNKIDYNQYETMYMSAAGFGSDAIKVINSRYTQDQIYGFTDISANALVSYFGRASYKYKDRYIIGGTYSRDGSSRFGANVRWAEFSSANFGWEFSKEPFLESLSSFLDYGKFRASWGINGKQFTENYLRYNAYDLGFGGNAYWANQLNVSTYAGVTGIVPNYNAIGNDELSWENSEQWNLGVDLDLFNRRFNVTFDAYNKLTDKLFFDVNFPAYSGYNSAKANVAGILNYGWETFVTYHVFPRENDLRLELGFGLSKNENYIDKLPNGNQDYIGSNYGYVVGRPINLYKLFINDYIIDDLSQLPVNPYTGQALTGKSAWAAIRPGFPIWKDLNSDYELNENPDLNLVREYSPVPDITGSFNINLKYKGWYFQAYSQFSFGADIMDTTTNSYLDSYDRTGDSWATRGLVDLSNFSFWEQPGDGAAGARYPALYPTTGSIGGPFYGFRGAQTLWIESGDYWKVTNASVGYTFDQQKQLRGTGLSRLRVYASVLNPYQWQKSKAVPDASMVDAKGYTYGNGYPQSKTITLGFDARF
ncbi:SusC/RagA family TonB-linked outer membrane protein [Cellulophaga sp. F20128]|uniref:SusC/RagA family TonB-linked outer membrane protein n=1 Tax=Cellulophaga sp. F20128 TaxID=2926413 RepID=UPI001FF5137D|nr:SusC/RagA family TonB-linked outer membrane protein [Cellulophaga sp. F20128]MCK0158038.1 SusC/RagA family TonB-linked outer membrane protein [Cellulophaga sp. F20128]